MPDTKTIRLELPATSANLGPGFDALGLAMQLALRVEAAASAEWALEASGRDRAKVGSLDGNLMVETYRDLLPGGPALRLRVENGIPLGMGCGSSAAALLGGVLLANHFGGLGLSDADVVSEGCRREGHPDNVAACFHGGMTASATLEDGMVMAATLGRDLPWRLLLAIPEEGLATTKARALLPESYSRADAVLNVQSTALLLAAFAQGRPELLRAGTRDRMHQPYRGGACPLLPMLLALAGTAGIYSVTLSGAGPSVLLIADERVPVGEQTAAIRRAAAGSHVEIVETRIAGGATVTAV